MFSDGDLIKMGWTKTKEKIGFLIGATVVAGLAVYVPSAILMAIGMQTRYPFVFILLAMLVMLFVGSLVGVGFTRIALGIVDGKQVSIGDLFKGTDRVLPYLGTIILYSLIVFGGTLLFIFPGIIWSLKYVYAPILAVDKGLGPMEALKASAALTDGVKWDILAFQGVLGYVVLIGYACLFVGVIVAIPVVMLATFGMYRHHQPDGAAVPKMSAQPAM